MSSFNLRRRLKSANKAWKSLTKTVRSKYERLEVSGEVKRITRRALKFLPSIRHHHRVQHGRRSSSHHESYCNLQMKSAAIYVDELFGGPSTLKRERNPSPNEAVRNIRAGSKITMTPKEKELGFGVKETQTNPATLADAWNNIAISSLPKLHNNIDEKAEEFISKFREDMKMQKTKSVLDFQDMLARSC